MNPWQKLAAGQQLRGLSAKAYNAMLDAALAHSARGLNTGSGAELRMPDGTINIRNDTTYDLGQFAVVGLDQVLIGPDLNAHEFKYRFAMRGEIPSGSDHRGRFGILVNPLPQGQIGRAWIAGAVCPCQINVQSLPSDFPPAGGMISQTAARVAVASPVNLTTDLADGRTLDGVTLLAGDRVVLTAQSAGVENGVYLVPSLGTPSRVTDFAAGDAVAGFTFQVTEGDTNGGIWVVSNNPGADTVDTDAITWMQCAGETASLTLGEEVRVVATANVALATALENGDILNGVTLATGDRVLVPAQTADTENGIYVVPASGAASRAADCGVGDSVAGFGYYVAEGDVSAGTMWTVTNVAGSDLVGTDAIRFARIRVQSIRKARIVNGESGYLESASAGGADVLWIQQGLGIRWALVRIGNMDLGTVRAVLLEPLASKGVAAGEIQVHDDEYDLYCGTGERITVRDHLGINETLPKCRPVAADPSISSVDYLLGAAGCEEDCACNLSIVGGGCLAIVGGGAATIVCEDA